MKMEELATYEKAINFKETSKWKEVMNEKMASLKANGTWIFGSITRKPKASII